MKDTMYKTLFPLGPEHYKWYFRLANTPAVRHMETEWILSLAKKAGVKPAFHVHGGSIAQWDGKYLRIANSYNTEMIQYSSEQLVIEFFKSFETSPSCSKNQHNNMSKTIDLSKKWYVKVGNDQDTFELLKKVIKVFKVPTYQMPHNITSIPQYYIRWNGVVIDDAIREDAVKGVYQQLTLAEALQWLSTYVGQPKYVDLGVNTLTSNPLARSMRVFKSGVQVRDLYGHNIHWIPAEDITRVYEAIQQLRKQQ